MSSPQRNPAAFRRSFCLAACLLLFNPLKATSIPRCEDEICIELEHLPGRVQFAVPPTAINYVLDLPTTPPTTGRKVYVHLMRAKTDGQFESIFNTSTTLFGKQKHSKWDPSKTPHKKRGDRFVLAATLEALDQNPRAITREFSIKWSDN